MSASTGSRETSYKAGLPCTSYTLKLLSSVVDTTLVQKPEPSVGSSLCHIQPMCGAPSPYERYDLCTAETVGADLCKGMGDSLARGARRVALKSRGSSYGNRRMATE